MLYLAQFKYSDIFAKITGSIKEPEFRKIHYVCKELFTTPVFGRVIRNTLYLVVVILPVQIVLGLAVSSVINGTRQVLFQRVGILCFYAPYVPPIVAIGILWKFLYHPSNFGIFNFLLSKVGIEVLRWLEDPKPALTSIAIMRIRQRACYVILIYFAGLQSIPKIYYEAADIDGCSPFGIYRCIAIPLLKTNLAT